MTPAPEPLLSVAPLVAPSNESPSTLRLLSDPPRSLGSRERAARFYSDPRPPDAVPPSGAQADVASRVSFPSRNVRLFVVALAASAVLFFVLVTNGPSASVLRVTADVRGTQLRSGDFIASVNGVRRFSSARQAVTVINNSRALGRPVRLVCIRDSSAVPLLAAGPACVVAASDSVTKITPPPVELPIGTELSVELAASKSVTKIAPPPVTSTALSVELADVLPTRPSGAVADSLSPAQSLLRRLRSSDSFCRAIASPGLFEICAGRGTISDAFNLAGVQPRLFSESDAYDQRYLCFRFPSPDAHVVGDFFTAAWQQPKSIAVVAGGISCVFVSPAGQQLGIRDPRSPISTDALPWAAHFFSSAFADFENVPAIATADGGSVLVYLDRNFDSVGLERVPRLPGLPLGLEVAKPNLDGAPGIRDRALGHYELKGLDALIGPCPPLVLQRSSPRTIQCILDVGPRDPSLIVRGVFEPVPVDLSNTRFPVTAGYVTVGGASVPLFVGSRVTARALQSKTWVLYRFLSATRLLLFFDSRREHEWLEFEPSSLARDDPLVHLTWSERVLDIRGTASATTSFGVPFIGCAKQLWLVGSDVVSPSLTELWRIQEYDTSTIADYDRANAGYLFEPARSKRLRSMPGKGLPTRLANAAALRTAARIRLLDAVLAGRIQPFFASLENSLAFSRAPFEQVGGCVQVFAVLVAWVDGEPRVLANVDESSLPATSSASHSPAPRAASTTRVRALFRTALPEDEPPACFLVDDFGWCQLVAVPLANHHPSQLAFHGLAWHALEELGRSSLRVPAYRALATVAGMLLRNSGSRLPPPALPGGAVPPQFVPQAPPVLAVDSALWERQQQQANAACAVLRDEFSSSTGHDASYYHEWAGLVKDMDPSAVPPNLRGVVADFSDDTFAHTPFSYRDAVPTTVPAPVPQQQVTGYRPKNVTPDIFPVRVADRWALWWPRVLRDLRHYLVNPNAKRTCNEPFVVAQAEMHPEARGVFWDLRSRRADGSFAPLDFAAEMETHLNTEYLATELADFPDQEMVYMITVTGVDFKVSHAAGQTVIFPHLESIVPAYNGVEDELRRLNGLTFNEFFDGFPFLPWCALGNGATARKKEIRMRRTTEGGGPRYYLADSSEIQVLSLNSRIGTKDLVPDAASRWCLPGLPTTTGHLTYDAAVRAHADSTRRYKPTKWPPEVKPRVDDLLHDITVLKHAAFCLGEDVYVFTSDAKDYFNQLRLAPWCLPHVGLIWTTLDASHSDYSCVAEYVLGFGYSNASNIAQRFAYGILDIFRRRFDREDAKHLAEDRVRAPRYFAARDAVSRATGRDESRLAVALMYTDDPIFVVVGARRAKRVIAAWREVTSAINLTLAVAAKHQGGANAEWLGLLQLAHLGALAIPLPKHSHALSEVRALLGKQTFTRERYHSIIGLLEHLLVYANGDRSAMAFLHRPLKVLQKEGPTAPVTVDDDMRRQLAAWELRLAKRAGISALAVFAHSKFAAAAQMGDTVIEYLISTDAASSGTAKPGIGGYCHGYRFRVPLDDADVRGPFKVPIPVLEFVGIAFAVCAFTPVIGGDANVLTIGSDSITSVHAVLNVSAHRELMQIVHDALLAFREYGAVRSRLRLGQIFGEGNVWADAESRGYDDVLRKLSKQLGVTPLNAPVPRHAIVLLNKVRAAIRGRPLTDTELRSTAAYNEQNNGDGPASLAIFSIKRAVSVHREPVMPPAATPRRPSLAVAAVPAAKRARVLSVPSTAPQPPCASDAAPPPGYGTPANALRGDVSAVRLEMVNQLATDHSAFALRPVNPDYLAQLAVDINECVHAGVPSSTLDKDTFAWKQWTLHLAQFQQPAWRPDRNDLDANGRARERFLFDSFFLEDYRRMVRSKPTAKPQSALNNHMAVKRVMRRGGVQPVETPNTSSILKGLLRQYVELHGAEILTPKRAEPLIKEDMAKILHPSLNGTPCGRTVVDWDAPRFRSFRAYLCTSRMAATRKADVLCKSASDFSKASASRAHLSWRVGGIIYPSLSAVQLRSLGLGDCAILTPVPVKNDPFAIYFGNHPIWLPYDPVDPHNAAMWLADLESAFPVADADRRSSPLFPGDSASDPLTHSMADTIFRAIAVAALGDTRAAQLSLHSARVFCACALLAKGAPRSIILALCRWKDERSLDVYARLNPAEYIAWMHKVSAAHVDAIAPRNMPQLDYDEAARQANAYLRTNPAAGDGG